jgi:hypothetical protein
LNSPPLACHSASTAGKQQFESFFGFDLEREERGYTALSEPFNVKSAREVAIPSSGYGELPSRVLLPELHLLLWLLFSWCPPFDTEIIGRAEPLKMSGVIYLGLLLLNHMD